MLAETESVELLSIVVPGRPLSYNKINYLSQLLSIHGSRYSP